MGFHHRSSSHGAAILESSAAGLLHFPPPPDLQAVPTARVSETPRRRRRGHKPTSIARHPRQG